MHSENEIVYLYLDDIIPNRFQPREVFDDRALQELAMSIKEHGVIQPIIVRNIGEKYEIIAGERRYKASAIAGLTKIPAIVRNLDDKESSKVALLENLQRRDLNSIEEARTYQKILELDQMTQEELAKTMGKSQSSIANKLRLLTLPEDIQDALLNEKISERHARSLLTLDTPQEQIEMMNKIINNRMTVRELDNEIKSIKSLNISTPEADNLPFSENLPERQPRFIHYDPIESENQTENFSSPEILTEEKLEQPPKVLADLDYLLNLTEEPTEKLSLDDQIHERLNKIPNVPIEEDVVEVPKQAEIEHLFLEEEPVVNSFDEKKDVLKQVPELFDLKMAINSIRDIVRDLEKKGIVITSEEMDFENLYQIIIKIDKNK